MTQQELDTIPIRQKFSFVEKDGVRTPVMNPIGPTWFGEDEVMCVADTEGNRWAFHKDPQTGEKFRTRE